MERARPDQVDLVNRAQMHGLRGSALKPPSPKKAGPRSFLAAIPQNFSSCVTCVNPRLSGFRQNGAVAGKPPMFDAQTTALLRAVLDEVCEAVSRYETSARTHVASMILEAASNGETSVDGLKQVGRRALSEAPILRN